MKVLRTGLLLYAAVACNLSFALTTKPEQQVAMEAFIAELKTHYGMAKYKNKMFGLNLEQTRLRYQKMIEEARTLEEASGLEPAQPREILPPEEFRQLMIGMNAELKDGHVTTTRQTKEVATLGLVTVDIGEKLIVTATRPDFMLSNASSKEIKPGDEIVELNGVPVAKLAQRNYLYAWGGTFEDRYNLAMTTVVNNPHALLRPIPEGTNASVKLRREGKEFLANLRWIYRSDLDVLMARFPKHFGNPPDKMQSEDGPVPYGARGTVRSYFRTGLLASDAAKSLIDVGAILNREIEEAKKAGDKGGPGGGPEADDDDEAGPKGKGDSIKDLKPVKRLQMYVVRRHGKNIGVLRIPSYSPKGGIADVKAEYLWVAQGLKKMEELCDVLLIDQVSNTGGFVYYTVKLMSLFAYDKPLQSVLTDIKLNSTVVEMERPKFGPDVVDGSSPSYAEWKLMENHYQELKRRFESGAQWTGLMPGFDLATPQFNERPGEVFSAKEAVFSKPVLILNDKMSGSGGDFFPAQMQANDRAKVMGETSAGLGGPVYRNIESMPGSELSFRNTYAYAQLPNGWPIENIGVVPDIYRGIEVADITDGFKKYAGEALDEAAKMAGWKPEEKSDGKKDEKAEDKKEAKKDEKPVHEIIPMPDVLKEDLILKTVFRRLEVLDRLQQMAELDRWKNDAENLALIKEWIEKTKNAKPDTWFADPTKLRENMKPLNPTAAQYDLAAKGNPGGPVIVKQ